MNVTGGLAVLGQASLIVQDLGHVNAEVAVSALRATHPYYYYYHYYYTHTTTTTTTDNTNTGATIIHYLALSNSPPAPAFASTSSSLIASQGAVVGTVSLFNICGRLLWSSFSDHIGRYAIFNIFACLGLILFPLIPMIAKQSTPGLIVVLGVVVSMYGGSWAVVAAYIKDVFGVEYAGSIHGCIVSTRSTWIV